MKFYLETELQENKEIKKVPKEWKICKLNEAIVECKTGIPVKKQDRISGSYPYFGANGIIDYVHDYIFDGEYVIVAQDGSIGAIHYFNGKFWANNHVWVIKTRPSIYAKFMYYFLQTLNWKRLITGSTRPKITENILLRISLPIPPFEEQRGIVEVLSCVDLAIEKVDEAIARAERLKKGLMQHLLTKGIGHKEYKETPIGKIPRNWEVNTFPDLFKIIDYRGRTPPFSNEGIPYVGADNIRNERLIMNFNRFVSEETYKKYMNRGLPKAGDILFTTEAPLGEVALVPENFKFCIAQRVIALRCKGNHNSAFFMYMLRSNMVQKQLESWATGTTAKGISQKNLKFIKVPYPKDGNEQQKIAEILSSVDNALHLKKKKREKLVKMKRRLMGLLLTGRVRVSV